MMKKFRTIAAILLAVAVFCGSAESAAMSAHAANDTYVQGDECTENAMGYVPDELVIETPRCYISDKDVLMATEIPNSYDMRDYGYVTSVKNQNPYGVCWAFSTLACIESNLIMNGYADSEVDLSEKHLGYFSFANAADKLGNTTGAYTVINDNSQNYLTVGGNSWIATNTLANWEGAVREEVMPYSDFDSTHTAQEAYSNNVYHLDNTYVVPIESRDYIKQLIMEKGAAEIGFYYSNSYMNIQTNAYCTKGVASSNHSVAIVGWDDNYSKENFLENYAPESDGAWLIKNSWGSDWMYGNEGYFWLSYEDSSINAEGNEATFFEAAPVKRDHNIYQYDGSSALSYFRENSGVTIANVYTAEGEECLAEISFYTAQCNVRYGVQVYKGVDSVPTDGTACFEQSFTGVVPAAGYHTVVLPEKVLLEAGEKFAVAVTLTSEDDSQIVVQIDRTVGGGTYSYFNGAEDGQSLVRLAGYSGWLDIGSQLNGTARIKGVTESTADVRGGCGENLTWELNDKGTLTISGTGAMTDWESKIKVPWDVFRDEIIEVVVEDGAASIGDYAFCNCGNLSKVVLPDSVTSLGIYAFGNSEALENINIPDKLTRIGGNAFSSCWGITELVLPDSVEEIGPNAFSNCKKLSSINIPAKLTEISFGMLDNCLKLENIVIPNGVTAIRERAFTGCSGVTEIILPDSVTEIGAQVFGNCFDLHTVKISGKITKLSERLFIGCSELTEVYIPGSVTSIEANVFNGCDSLSDVYYAGAREQWQSVDISETENDPLYAATVHCSDDRTAGDITGDGEISMLDSIILRRWLAGWEGVAIDEANADVTGDGMVTVMDSTVLRRYLAGWEGVELQ